MFFKNFGNALGISPEVTNGEAKLVMISNEELLCSGYRGLLEYSDECIRLAVKNKEITIIGKKLMIKTIESEEIVILGLIKSVEFL